MNKEEFLKAIENVPKTDSINSISAYNSINVEDLANAVERFKKIPTYDELLKENQELKKQLEKYENELEKDTQKYKEVIDKAINNSQDWIDFYTKLNSDERIALRLQENIDILKEVK